MKKIPEHLKLRNDEDNIGEWCLIRYMKKDNLYCGPLSLCGSSPDCLGFPVNGDIAPDVLTFSSREDAQNFIDNSFSHLGGVPELVNDQLFRVEVFNHWNRTTSIIYEGSDLMKVRTAYLEQLGKKAYLKNDYLKVIITSSKKEVNEEYQGGKNV